MITHLTYKDEAGDWLEPGEVARDEPALGRRRRPPAGDRRPCREDEQVQAQHGRPDGIIEAYGADTARLFMLSDSPPERDLEWTDAGVDGAWRYLNRLWRLVEERAPPSPPAATAAASRARRGQGAQAPGPPDHRPGDRRARAAALQQGRGPGARAVQRDRGRSRRRPPATGRSCARLWRRGRPAGPMMPHLAEELWQRLGHERSWSRRAGPRPIPPGSPPIRSSSPIQVNGKRRAELELPRGSCPRQIEALALADAAVQRAMEGKPPRRVVVVPDKIVNVVV